MSYQISNEEAIKKDDELEKLLGDSKWKYEEG
jgi:hypothetical protein